MTSYRVSGFFGGTFSYGLVYIGAVADSTARNALADLTAGEFVFQTDTGHLWVWNGETWDDWGVLTAITLPLPLFALTGTTAALPPGEAPLATYADMAALLAAEPPTAQGERIQVAENTEVELYEGRYISGAWAWVIV